MESITNTIHNITEGFTVADEAQILPIYCDGELANGVTYAAYRFKRFAQAAGRFTTEAACRTVHATIAAVDHVQRYGGTGNFGEV